jgi:hypothetical protein
MLSAHCAKLDFRQCWGQTSALRKHHSSQIVCDVSPLSSEVGLMPKLKSNSSSQELGDQDCCTTPREPFPHGLELCSAHSVLPYTAGLVWYGNVCAWTVLRETIGGKGLGRRVWHSPQKCILEALGVTPSACRDFRQQIATSVLLSPVVLLRQ